MTTKKIKEENAKLKNDMEQMSQPPEMKTTTDFMRGITSLKMIMKLLKKKIMI